MVTPSLVPWWTVKTADDVKALIKHAIESYMQNGGKWTVELDEFLWEEIDDPAGVEAIVEYCNEWEWD